MKKFILLTLFCSFLIQANIIEKHDIYIKCSDASNQIDSYFLTEPNKLTIGDLIERTGWYPIKVIIKNNSSISVKPKGFIGLIPMNNEGVQETLSRFNVLFSSKINYKPLLLFCIFFPPLIFLILPLLIPVLLSENLNIQISPMELIILKEQLNKLLLIIDQEIAPGQEVEKFILLPKEGYQKGSFTLFFEQGKDVFDFCCKFKDTTFDLLNFL